MRLLYIMSFFVFLTRHPREGFVIYSTTLLYAKVSIPKVITFSLSLLINVQV